jgi:NADPH2:quinone reductase
MLAVFYESTGPAEAVLKLGEVAEPHAGPGEVRVRVAVSGVNPIDGYQRGGLLGPLGFPRIVPSHDGAGVVDEVGPGVDRSRLGERVWIFNAQWQRPSGTMATWLDFAQGATLSVVAPTAHAALMSP